MTKFLSTNFRKRSSTLEAIDDRVGPKITMNGYNYRKNNSKDDSLTMMAMLLDQLGWGDCVVSGKHITYTITCKDKPATSRTR